MRLFVELFVRDLARARDFYRDVIGLAVEREDADVIVLRRASAQIHLLPLEDLPSPLAAAGTGPLGSRVEFVFEVDDVMAWEARVRAAGWPIFEPLRRQPWHRTDFRVVDPDGAYVRVTSPASD
jgi:catechol 2,3-dioxygenase-like lactoylglutathione lyase family enzyme